MKMLKSLERLLPESKPWIFIDRLLLLEPGTRIITCKLISTSDYFLRGHFLEYSVYPGVLLIEGVRQSTRLMLDRSATSGSSNWTCGDMNVRWLAPALPGDVIHYDVSAEAVADEEQTWIVSASGSISGKIMFRYKAKWVGTGCE